MFKKGYEKLNASGKNLVVTLGILLPLVMAVIYGVVYGGEEMLQTVMHAALAGMITLASYGAVLLVALGIMSRKDRPIEQP